MRKVSQTPHPHLPLFRVVTTVRLPRLAALPSLRVLRVELKLVRVKMAYSVRTLLRVQIYHLTLHVA